MKKIPFFLAMCCWVLNALAQTPNYYRPSDRIYLDSKEQHEGKAEWLMCKASDLQVSSESVSKAGLDTKDWMKAIVPGTVLTSLVHNGKLPNPEYGLNNKLDKNLIPDLAKVGRDYYTYWFRTEFEVPASYAGKTVWMQVDGINYRAEIWINGQLFAVMGGMFKPAYIDFTRVAKVGGKNVVAVKVYPVDVPGEPMPKNKQWGAANNEWHNGGDGLIGYNTTMLMTAGWDFTFMDGIRDRCTGIWRSISIYATDAVVLRHPFVITDLRHPDYKQSSQTVKVDVLNNSLDSVDCEVRGEIVGEGIKFGKTVRLLRGIEKEVAFTPEEFPQLVINNPRLWWPAFKGPQNLYELKLQVVVNGKVSSETKTRFGIREIVSNAESPDHSRQFIVNGKKLFIRGTNWIPEAMLNQPDERMYAEVRYTAQSGFNMIRLWGGGIAESDYFFQLCDEMGLLVWTEFWMTGDTRHPQDGALHLANAEATIKRLRSHPSLAFYVCSNESTELAGIEELVTTLDGTRAYQMQSECCGIHDGSPYKQVNPMQHYEDRASERGSRIYGFNPEYGAPSLPLVESIRKMMPEKDLWPINPEVWNYMDGDGFFKMASLYKELSDNYGKCTSIDDYCQKGQFLAAMNSKAIWECWNYNKHEYGDRYASGTLYWSNSCPVYRVDAKMYDYFLEPTAMLYHTQNAMEPLHPQFDYIKNTVSVCNEYYQSFANYKVTAEVYDIDSRRVWQKSATVNIPEDGVVNDVFKIDFPAGISQVHFIKLRLFDDKGKQVGDNFYWRSNDKYEGAWTTTGPATSGFEDISKLKEVTLKAKASTSQKNDRNYVQVEVKNPSNTIAYFVQIQLVDDKLEPVRPSFWTDNFFSLLPGEGKTITIDTALKDMPGKMRLVVKGWNIKRQEIGL